VLGGEGGGRRGVGIHSTVAYLLFELFAGRILLMAYVWTARKGK